MIKISVFKSSSFISKIVIKGHANYDKYGSDIVCASVSSVCITTVNAILLINKESISYESLNGYLSININNDNITQLLIQNMLNMLNELKTDYTKYIKILFEEV